MQVEVAVGDMLLPEPEPVPVPAPVSPLGGAAPAPLLQDEDREEDGGGMPVVQPWNLGFRGPGVGAVVFAVLGAAFVALACFALPFLVIPAMALLTA